MNPFAAPEPPSATQTGDGTMDDVLLPSDPEGRKDLRQSLRPSRAGSKQPSRAGSKQSVSSFLLRDCTKQSANSIRKSSKMSMGPSPRSTVSRFRSAMPSPSVGPSDPDEDDASVISGFQPELWEVIDDLVMQRSPHPLQGVLGRRGSSVVGATAFPESAHVQEGWQEFWAHYKQKVTEGKPRGGLADRQGTYRGHKQGDVGSAPLSARTPWRPVAPSTPLSPRPPRSPRSPQKLGTRGSSVSYAVAARTWSPPPDDSDESEDEGMSLNIPALSERGAMRPTLSIPPRMAGVFASAWRDGAALEDDEALVTGTSFASLRMETAGREPLDSSLRMASPRSLAGDGGEAGPAGLARSDPSRLPVLAFEKRRQAQAQVKALKNLEQLRERQAILRSAPKAAVPTAKCYRPGLSLSRMPDVQQRLYVPAKDALRVAELQLDAQELIDKGSSEPQRSWGSAMHEYMVVREWREKARLARDGADCGASASPSPEVASPPRPAAGMPTYVRPWDRGRVTDVQAARRPELTSLQRFAEVCRSCDVHPHPAALRFLARESGMLVVRAAYMSDAETAALAASLPESSQLTVLDLGQNDRLSDESICSLLRKVAPGSPKLRELCLDRCSRLGEQTVTLCTSYMKDFFRSLHTLDLSGIRIARPQYEALAESIESAPRLKDVRLAETGLGAFDAAGIVAMVGPRPAPLPPLSLSLSGTN